MRLAKKNIYGSSSVEPNVVFRSRGGHTIKTVEDLISKVYAFDSNPFALNDISLSNIKAFKIINDDVYFNCNIRLVLKQNAFKQDPYLISIDNLDDKLILYSLGQYGVQNTVNKLQEITDYRVDTEVLNFSFSGLKSERLNLPNLEGNGHLKLMNDSDIVYAPSLTSLSTRSMGNGSSIFKLDIPNVRFIEPNVFNRARRLSIINTPALESFNINVFAGQAWLPANGTITVPLALKTSNNGNPESGFSYLINRGWTINYI